MGDLTTMRSRLAANIRAELARQRISGAAISAAIGVEKSAVSRRLNGEASFYGQEIAVIAATWDIPLTLIFADVVRTGEGVTPGVGTTMDTEATP